MEYCAKCKIHHNTIDYVTQFSNEIDRGSQFDVDPTTTVPDTTTTTMPPTTTTTMPEETQEEDKR